MAPCCSALYSLHTARKRSAVLLYDASLKQALAAKPLTLLATSWTALTTCGGMCHNADADDQHITIPASSKQEVALGTIAGWAHVSHAPPRMLITLHVHSIFNFQACHIPAGMSPMLAGK
jgi:hypothetical protein